MKTKLLFRTLFTALLLGAALDAWAATIQRLELIDRVDPRFPSSLPMLGVTRGNVRCVVNVDREGRVEEVLIAAYTHEALARAVRDVVPLWKFRPAAVDGKPIGAQTMLEISMEITGAVTSMDVTTYVVTRMEAMMGQQYVYRDWNLKDLDALPIPQHTVAPIYPEELERQGQRGMVRVEFFIDEKGQVRMPVVERFEHAELAAFALEAIRQWRFSPPLRDGRPVLVRASQDFQFGSGTR